MTTILIEAKPGKKLNVIEIGKFGKIIEVGPDDQYLTISVAPHKLHLVRSPDFEITWTENANNLLRKN